MKKITLILMTILLMSTICSAQYDPPSGHTTYYHLRMWDEGDRPGADSINQNLKDIDLILRTGVIHPTGFEILPGQKRFTNKIEIGTPGSSLSTDSANKIWNRTFFMNEAPRCTYNPDNTASLTNKSYVDGAITTAGAEYMHIAGPEDITGVKTFQAHTTLIGGTTTFTGNHFENRNDFTTQAPYCTFVPLSSSQLANKYYVDSAGTSFVRLAGTEFITGSKTFTAVTTSFGDDAQGNSYLNIIATDGVGFKFNDDTFLSWDGLKLTVDGAVDATGYKVSGVTKYLTSAFGVNSRPEIWLSTTNGGTTNRQLTSVPLTINGVTYNILVTE